MSKTLVEMTADIIQSQISGTDMSTEEIKIASTTPIKRLKTYRKQNKPEQILRQKKTNRQWTPKDLFRKIKLFA
jgi:hypothetical protein